MNSPKKKILTRILDNEKDIPSPFHPEGIINVLYVIVDKESRMGYACVWCSKTFKGGPNFRLQVPDVENVIYNEDVSKLDMQFDTNINWEKFLNKEV